MNVKFDDKGLVPVITQDDKTKEVLMHAYMNREALSKTVETGKVHYYSRSRGKLWLKGETSGHFQLVKKIMYDCDADCLLILADQTGGACHTGHFSCFYRELEREGADGLDGDENASRMAFDPGKVYAKDALKELYAVIIDRRDNPREGSYTNYLLDKGVDKTLKKVGEETAEVIIASKNEDKAEVVYEIADLMYHLSVLMTQRGVSWDEIYTELQKRQK